MNRKTMLKLLPVLFLSFLFASCKKNAYVSNNDYPSAYPLLSKGGLTQYSMSKWSGFEPLNLNVAVPIAGNLTKDMNVTIKIDTAALGKYNREKLTNYKLLPADAYKITEQFVIPKGDYKMAVPVSVNLSKYAFDDFQYILPITLVDAGGLPTSPNFTTVLLNIWPPDLSGGYAATGVRDVYTTPTATAPGSSIPILSPNHDKTLVRTGKVSYESAVTAQNYSGPMRLKINADFTVQVSGLLLANVLQPYQTSTYDHDTKTFNLSYWYDVGSSGFRRIKEKLVKK